jgi:hypothetical protein
MCARVYVDIAVLVYVCLNIDLWFILFLYVQKVSSQPYSSVKSIDTLLHSSITDVRLFDDKVNKCRGC